MTKLEVKVLNYLERNNVEYNKKRSLEYEIKFPVKGLDMKDKTTKELILDLTNDFRSFVVQTNKRFDNVDTRLDKIEKRVNKIEKRVDTLENHHK